MALRSVTDLEAYGTVQRPASNVPFSVEDPDSVWIVEAGKLYVFLVDLQYGEPSGARYHVMQVEAPHAVFGVGSHLRGVALMATAVPETRLLRIPREHLTGERRLTGDDDLAQRLVENWISQLSAAISETMAPNPMVLLEPHGTVTIAEEPKAIVPKQGVLWVTHQQGKSLFLADAALPTVNGTGSFPINKLSWLEAAPGSVISSLDTPSVLQTDEGWRGLNNFHALALPALLANRKRATLREKKRLQARASADITRVDNALHRLSSPMGDERRCNALSTRVMSALARAWSRFFSRSVALFRFASSAGKASA